MKFIRLACFVCFLIFFNVLLCSCLGIKEKTAFDFKPALSTNDKVINENFFKECSDSGIQAIEIAPSSYENIDYNEISRLSKKYNVKLWSFHLPYMPFDTVDISNSEIATETVNLFKDYINKAHAIGINVFIIHPSGEPIADENRKARLDCAKNSLKNLADYADELGCTIAVENLPRTCLGKNSNEILQLISAHENLRVCVDTNHLMNEELTNFIKAVNKKIITTHFSDFDFINERHWLPGEGKIKWQDVINTLNEVEYNGYILYEVSFNAPWSIERNRNLNCEDIINNFKELVGGNQPKPIGKPKENIGMWEPKQ